MEPFVTSLDGRFRQLNAPGVFTPGTGVPLRWRCDGVRPGCVTVFDPDANTGFVLRMYGGGVDIAFHLDGRIARMMVDRRVVEDAEEQESVLNSLLPVQIL